MLLECSGVLCFWKPRKVYIKSYTASNQGCAQVWNKGSGYLSLYFLQKSAVIFGFSMKVGKTIIASC